MGGLGGNAQLFWYFANDSLLEIAFEPLEYSVHSMDRGADGYIGAMTNNNTVRAAS